MVGAASAVLASSDHAENFILIYRYRGLRKDATTYPLRQEPKGRGKGRSELVGLEYFDSRGGGRMPVYICMCEVDVMMFPVDRLSGYQDRPGTMTPGTRGVRTDHSDKSPNSPSHRHNYQDYYCRILSLLSPVISILVQHKTSVRQIVFLVSALCLSYRAVSFSLVYGAPRLDLIFFLLRTSGPWFARISFPPYISFYEPSSTISRFDSVSRLRGLS